jgi:hypothetical protein
MCTKLSLPSVSHEVTLVLLTYSFRAYGTFGHKRLRKHDLFHSKSLTQINAYIHNIYYITGRETGHFARLLLLPNGKHLLSNLQLNSAWSHVFLMSVPCIGRSKFLAKRGLWYFTMIKLKADLNSRILLQHLNVSVILTSLLQNVMVALCFSFLPYIKFLSLVF